MVTLGVGIVRRHQVILVEVDMSLYERGMMVCGVMLLEPIIMGNNLVDARCWC